MIDQKTLKTQRILIAYVKAAPGIKRRIVTERAVRVAAGQASRFSQAAVNTAGRATITALLHTKKGRNVLARLESVRRKKTITPAQLAKEYRLL